MQAENLAQAANLIWGFDPKVIATAIVVVCYIILFTEKLNRAVVALLGACVMIFSGILTQATALQGIDFNTISLLVGMMTIVGISEKSGMFQYVAIWGVQRVKANPRGTVTRAGRRNGRIFGFSGQCHHRSADCAGDFQNYPKTQYQPLPVPAA